MIIAKRAQYPIFYTYHFRIPYNWFALPNANTELKSLFWLPHRSVIALVEIYPSIQFIGATITSMKVFLLNTNNSTSSQDLGNTYCACELGLPVGPNKGAYGGISNKVYGTGNNTYSYIENRTAGQEMFLRLVTNSSGRLVNLTQGFFDIWITTYRNI